MKVLLLGGGASFATLKPKSPLSEGFGETLKQDSNWRETFPFLASAVSFLNGQYKIIDDKGGFSLNLLWNGIDENFKLSSLVASNSIQWPTNVPQRRLYSRYCSHTWENFWVLAGWELKRAFNKIYGEDVVPLLNKGSLQGKWIYDKQIKNLSNDDIIASFNCDLLAENFVRLSWRSSQNCLDDSEFSKRMPEQGPLILKLHGSLDWKFRSNLCCSKQNEVVRTRDGGPVRDGEIDLDHGMWETRPLIVGYVQYQDELIFQQYQPYVLKKIISFQWIKFIEAISKADELIVLGYRFPQEDEYGHRIFGEAIRRRVKNDALRINLYLPNSSCCKVKAQLKCMFEKAVDIKCCGKISDN